MSEGREPPWPDTAGVPLKVPDTGVPVMGVDTNDDYTIMRVTPSGYAILHPDIVAGLKRIECKLDWLANAKPWPSDPQATPSDRFAGVATLGIKDTQTGAIYAIGSVYSRNALLRLLNEYVAKEHKD